jgi:hypothetical protein
VFAVGLTIARPYFVETTAVADVNTSLVQQQEKGNFFSKLVWQLENSSELEEDEEDSDSSSKFLVFQSTFFNTPFSCNFKNTNASQINLLLDSIKRLPTFSRLFILFENLRN